MDGRHIFLCGRSNLEWRAPTYMHHKDGTGHVAYFVDVLQNQTFLLLYCDQQSSDMRSILIMSQLHVVFLMRHCEHRQLNSNIKKKHQNAKPVAKTTRL